MITLNATGTHYHAQVEEGDTRQLRRILTEYLPKVMDKFARKNRQYGENDFPLGPAAQYPEIERKVRLLKAVLWDGRESAASIDGVDDTIDDLIGHLLMLKDCLALKRRGGYAGPRPPVIPPVGSIAVPRVPTVSEPDELGVLRYPPGFRGRSSYRVAEPRGGNWMFAAHGHKLRMAIIGKHERCPWKLGDERGGDVQCVGIAGHETHRPGDDDDLLVVMGDVDEQWHINHELEAWPV